MYDFTHLEHVINRYRIEIMASRSRNGRNVKINKNASKQMKKPNIINYQPYITYIIQNIIVNSGILHIHSQARSLPATKALTMGHKHIMYIMYSLQ